MTERQPQHVVWLHGAPCHECARPAKALGLFANGSSVVHLERGVAPCTRLAHTTPNIEETR